LKIKLEGGKKRQREPENAESTTLPSDDEEESRAGAIKKKARQDPFDLTLKKRKHEKVRRGPTTQTKSVATHTISQSQPTTAVGRAPLGTPDQVLANSSLTTSDRTPSPASKVSGAPLKSPTQSTPTPVSTLPVILVGVSPTATPLLSPAHRAELFKGPLLNLGGSPSEDEIETEKTNALPKRKRKRRKKKKSSQDVGIPLAERQ
jgi:hypothetical protein